MPIIKNKKKKEGEIVAQDQAPEPTDIGTQPTAPASTNKVGEIQTFTNADTGKLSGITTPSGETLVGLSPREVRGLAENFALKSGKIGLPSGTVAASDVAQKRQMKEQTQEIAQGQSNIAQQDQAIAQDNINPVVLDNIESGQQQTQGQANTRAPTISEQLGRAKQVVETVATGGLGLLNPKNAEFRQELQRFPRIAFDIYDNLRSTISGGDTVKVKDARQTLSQAKTAINQDIQLVKAGLLDPSEALLDFEAAEIGIASLSSAVKTKDMQNFRYWLRDGRDIEIELELRQRELINLKKELLLAALQSGA